MPIQFKNLLRIEIRTSLKPKKDQNEAFLPATYFDSFNFKKIIHVYISAKLPPPAPPLTPSRLSSCKDYVEQGASLNKQFHCEWHSDWINRWIATYRSEMYIILINSVCNQISAVKLSTKLLRLIEMHKKNVKKKIVKKEREKYLRIFDQTCFVKGMAASETEGSCHGVLSKLLS